MTHPTWSLNANFNTADMNLNSPLFPRFPYKIEKKYMDAGNNTKYGSKIYYQPRILLIHQKVTIVIVISGWKM